MTTWFNQYAGRLVAGMSGFVALLSWQIGKPLVGLAYAVIACVALGWTLDRQRGD